MSEPQLQSTLTCPHCGHPATEQMPINVCVVIYACKACGKELRPLPGDCCVFCFLRLYAVSVYPRGARAPCITYIDRLTTANWDPAALQQSKIL